MVFPTKTNGYKKLCDTNKNVTKMVVMIKGVIVYFLKGEKEEVVLDIVLEMVFKIRVCRRSFSWEATCLWHWR
jgi:hypothetical protein